MTKVAFTAPHKQASEIGLSLLKEGAHAVDAMISAAAAISVCYPHMNSIGGDGFWLIQVPGEDPIAIDACGTSAKNTKLSAFLKCGFSTIPPRGPEACITVGGTISGWELGREIMEKQFGKKNCPLNEVLSPARDLARNGIIVTKSLETASQKVGTELRNLADTSIFKPYQNIFSKSEKTLREGQTLQNLDLANTFDQLIHCGLADFYRGSLAEVIAGALSDIGSEITLSDLNQYSAIQVDPLSVKLQSSKVFNLPPPTQGLASLLILAIYDQIYHADLSTAERVHYLIEATKEAFKIRDRFICDPSRSTLSANEILSYENIKGLAKTLGPKAQEWPHSAEPGDTVWMGCIDNAGVMVSFIQSVYWEFGSAIVIPNTGIVWNNRGSSFSLQEKHHNCLGAGLKPFHTLNPAFAQFDDGKRIVYGTMGGEGQPQTQAAVFARTFYDNFDITSAISEGRWLLGRTWGDENSDLKLEDDLYKTIGKDLENFGHTIKVVASKNELMGHAGGIIAYPSGEIECATDPRSDGLAIIA